MMWKLKELSKDDKIIRLQLVGAKDETISYSKWISLLEESNEFINYFNDILSSCSFVGFFWEVKPITRNHLNEDFEFVMVNSRILNTIKPNSNPFQLHFKEDNLVVHFSNLGGDAQLVVPCPINDKSDYAHLARFVRTADEAQIQDFWKRVAVQYKTGLQATNDTKWLSTAGLGVYWLHIRIDSRPKYYRYQAYKDNPYF